MVNPTRFVWKRLALVAFIAAISAFPALAQEAKFYAATDRNPVTEGERLRVNFILENGNGSNFQAPSFSGFKVLSGPNTSMSTQIVNGRMSQSRTYSYILEATKIGTYEIGSATIKVGGKTLRSNPIKINVVEPSEREKARRQAEKERQENLSDQAQRIIRENLFIRLSTNKSTVAEGEQITATYKIYYNPNLNIRPTNYDMPSFSGFWAQDFDISESAPSREVIDNTMFYVQTVKKVVLVPLRSGKLTVEPMKMDCVVRLQVQGGSRRRSMWDDFFDDPFFGGRYQDFEYTASSETSTINVKPLPSPTPENFSGAVGDLQMDAWLDKIETTTNDAVTLKVKIAGRGNLNLLEAPKVNFPPDFDVYDPQIVDNISVTAAGISGERVFEYVIIPKNAGNFKIDPVEFVYYDLEKGKYQTIKSQEFELKVGKGKGGSSQSVTGVSKSNVEYLGKDIRFIKTKADLSKKRGEFLGSAGFIVLSVLPGALFVLFIVFKRKIEERRSDIAGMKNRRATKLAKKRLETAKKIMDSGSGGDKFYEEVSKALWGYLSDKLTIPNSDLTKDNSYSALTSRNVSSETADSYLALIDNCELARFSPSGEAGDMRKTYEQATEKIAKVEEELK